MNMNVFLTTAFEIECRVTSTGFRAPASPAQLAHAGRHSPLSPFHFVEIEGELPFLFVTEATDA